ncbi:MAG: site-specific integrase [Oscillospiraceae bacterium]|nr:site-specific integrase [Oscillospiraceae bacterium]
MAITKTGKKKDGKMQYRVRVSYQNAKGKQVQIERTAYGNSEAVMLEQQLINDYIKKNANSSRMTIGELFDEYEKYHATETKKTSHDSVMKALRLRVLPTMTDYRLDKLTQPILARWKIEISGQDLALKTKQFAYKSFSSMLNYAVKMEYIPKNPLTILGNFKDPNVSESPSEVLHYYTPEDFIKFITVAHNHTETIIDWGYYVFFNIAFYTGARKGEINALKWSDIDGNIMHIRRSIAQKVKGGDIETPPKNKSSYRDLQIPSPLLNILEEHKNRQKDGAQNFSDDFRICGGEKPLRDSSIDKRNRLYSTEAELPHIRVHDFRHSHASLLANNGINIQEVSRRLGHSSVKMTWDTYSHLYPKEEERAINVLNTIVE